MIEHAESSGVVIARWFDDAVGATSTVIERVEQMTDARARLVSERYDVVLLDLSVSDGGVSGVRLLCECAPEVPIVVMTDPADEGLAITAVRAGAQDYFTKGDDSERIVRHAVRHAIERHRLRREREASLASEREARGAAEHAARVRDEVLGMVSHDLRSPLSAIALSGKALLEGTGDARVLAGVIVRSAEWALRIIRDLLDVTAIEAGSLAVYREPMTAQAITDAIASMFEASAASAGVTLVVERAESTVWVDADVDRVVQAVGNLVGNAIKFTPRGGTVTVAVHRDGSDVRFRVEDTGIGIAPDDVPRLFDRFWQARESGRSGAGLGLVITKAIAEKHRGRVEVESRVGQGTVFTLVIPDP
jgi:signal transduction histidine kinase